MQKTVCHLDDLQLPTMVIFNSLQLSIDPVLCFSVYCDKLILGYVIS